MPCLTLPMQDHSISPAATVQDRVFVKASDGILEIRCPNGDASAMQAHRRIIQLVDCVARDP